MIEKDARWILFFRALVETDHEGVILPSTLVEKVRKKLEPLGKNSDYFPRFCRDLEKSASAISNINFPKYYMVFTFNPGNLSLLLLISFFLGLTSNYFGVGHKVNILLNPLTILLGWNFAAYLILLFKGVIFRKHTFLAANTVFQLINFSRNIIEKFNLLFLKKSKTASLLRNARIYFIELWLGVAKDLSATRIFFILNTMAIGLACGVVAGLYFRGLFQEYQFAWFSTFDKSIVMNLGKVIFAPALFITQESMPTENMGAAWIHLFAVTAVFYIIVPRFLILFYTQLKIKHLSGSVEPDLTLPFFSKWLMGAVNIDLYSYSYSLDDIKLSTLNETFKKVFGLFDKKVAKNIPWGGSLPHSLNENRIPVFCFNAAQTPENEVHGEFLNHILQQTNSCMVIVDYSRLTEQQQNSRFLLWKNLLEDFVGLNRFYWANLEKISIANDSELASALWRKNH
ncbi:MAG: hypothetical protein HKO79_08705 [Desulfobacterales bacterium]|nr:hypothetical protein [Deltaproteobacteria bacterium]NNL42562.1 hypothetical protein [Desulfobacterales bacterium]